MASNNNKISVSVDFSANVSSFNSSLNTIKGELSKLKVGDGLKDSFSKTFSKLESEIENFQKLTSSGKTDVVNLKEIEKSQAKIEQLFDALKSGFSSLKMKNTPLASYGKQIDVLKSKMSDFNKTISSSDASNKVSSLTKQFNSQQAAIERVSAQLDSYKTKLNELQNSEVGKAYADVEAYMTKQIEAQAAKGKTSKYAAYQGKDGKIDVSSAVQSGALDGNSRLLNQVEVLKQNAEAAKTYSADIIKAQKDIAKAEVSYNKSTGIGAALEKDLQEAKTALATFKDSEFKDFIKNLSQSADVQGIDIDWDKILNADDYAAAVNKLQEEGNEAGAEVLTKMAKGATEGGNAVKDAGTKIAASAEDLRKLTEQQAEVDRLYNSLTQFFSISSGINLFKRAISGAYDAIKELDSAMTEVAVVTDFSVGDMWDQLPDYTAKANELGVAISQVYDAAALYYQQGLNTTQVNSLLNSTLKMARIASLDAATATDRMTNALRGFNMEINETNANHIADVYSELAAKTASDVDELSTAMTKTASIASSANMSFENTAAFLAQGIETTRESAETIGTMLKTVIGRFTEVKSAWTTGELQAEVDGEEINVNKVAEALRTAGINLNEFFTGAKGLDEIFIELSSKWDSLDLVTQRYIATQAAGSRQQSRFIALMQDYERQQELIGYAYNSSGAAESQYEKTLDSLETKLSQLKNAWDTFTMGIANNEAVKAGVDALTGLITVINNLTSTLGTTGGMIANIGIGVGGFLGGKKLISKVFKGIVSTYMDYGQQSGKGFFDGFKSVFTKSGWKNVFKGDGTPTTLDSFGVLETLPDDLQTKIKAGIKNVDWASVGTDLNSQTKALLKNSSLSPSELAASFQNSSNQYISNTFKTLDLEDFSDLDSVHAALEMACADFEKAGGKAEDFWASVSSSGRTANSVVESIQTITAACTMASVAFSAIGQSLSNAGNTEAGEAFSNIATAIGLIGGALTIVIPILKTFGVSLTAAFAPLMIIVGIITAAVVAFNIWDSQVETAAEKTERLDDALQLSQEAAEGAKQAYEDLQESIQGFEDTQNALDGLIEGTDEFRQAIINANQQVLELLETYPALAKYLTKNEHGGLTIDSEGLDELQEWQDEAILRAQGGNLTAQIADLQDQKTTNDKTVNDWYDLIASNFASINQTEDIKSTIEDIIEKSNNVGDDLVTEIYYALTHNEDLDVIDWNGSAGDTIKTYLPEIVNAIQARNDANDEIALEQESLLNSLLKTKLSDSDLASEYAAAADYYTASGSTQLVDKVDEIYKGITSGDGNSNAQGIQNLINELKNGDYEGVSKDAITAYVTDTSGGLETYKQVYKAITGSETDSTDISNIATEIANALGSGEFAGKASELIQSMEDFAAQGEEEKGIADTLTQLYSGTLDEDTTNQLVENINNLVTKEEQWTELATAHGYEDTSEFEDSLTLIAKELQQKYTEQRESLGLATAKLGMGEGSDKKNMSYDTDLSIENVEIATDIYSDIAENFSEATAQAIGDSLSKFKLTDENFEDMKWLQDLDYSDAIGSADKLREKIAEIEKAGDNASEALKEAYKAMAESSTFNEAAQVKQVYTELSDELDELADSSEGITGSGLEALATKGSNLEKVLKSDKVSVTGLAKAFSALKSGQISINGLTTRVIEATSKIFSLDDALQKAFDNLSNFSGFDRGQGMDTLKGWSDTVKEYIDNYEYGNASDYLSEVFIGYDDEMAEAAQKVLNNEISIEDYEQTITDYGSKLQNLFSNDGYNALLEAANSGEFEYIVPDGENGFSILLDQIEEDNISYEGFVHELGKSLGVKDDIATAIIGTYASRDPIFNDQIQQMSYNDAIESFIGSVGVGEGGIVNSEEVKAMAATTGYEESTITDTLEEKKVVVLELTDEDGNELDSASIHENLINAVNSLWPEDTGKMSTGSRSLAVALDAEFDPTQIEDSFTQLRAHDIKIDTTSAMESLQNLGFTADQAKAELDKLAEDNSIELTTTVQVPKELQDGTYTIEEVEVTADSMDELEASAEMELQEAYSNMQAEATAEAFQDLEITVTVSEGSITNVSEVTEQIQNWGDEEHPINVTDDQVQTALTTAIDLTTAVDGDYTLGLTYTDITAAKGEATALITLVDEANKAIASLEVPQISSNSSSKSDGGGSSLYGTAHSQGTGTTAKSETALVGEMGQEMVVTKDGWYTVGDNGPEFTNIPAGSVVFNARQTQDLLTKGKTSTHGKAWLYGNAYYNGRARWNLTDPVPNYYGSEAATESAASAAESAADSTEEAAEVWLNTLDKLYNLVEKIEEETRRREILEKKYEQIIRDQSLTIYQIRDNYEAQLESLDKQLAYQQELQRGRLDQINNVGNEKYEQDGAITTYAATGATGYARYNQSTNTIEIDWDRIDAITDKNLGDAVNSYIDRLEELQDQYEDTYEELLNIEDEVYSLNQTYREQYEDFSQRIYDALVQLEQDRITSLQTMYSQISQDNTNILDALREQVDLERQIRDNTEKEKEIAEAESELAYLRRDTSNGNLVEIKKLEQELEDLRESYADDLIDQKLDNLQDDNEKAAAQRDMQIEQLNAILEYNQEHGAFWDNVENLITSAFSSSGELSLTSDLVNKLKETDGFKAMSDVAKDTWSKEFASAFQISAKGLENWKVEDANAKGKSGEQTSITLGNGATVTYDAGSGKWRSGNTLYNLTYDATTGKYGVKKYKDLVTTPAKQTSTTPYSDVNWDLARKYYNNVNNGRYGDGSTRDAQALADGINAASGKMGQYALNALYMRGIGFDDFKNRVLNGTSPSSFGGTYHFPNFTAFETGGLADFTGPAWLDGTKSHPELVLNARDSENFMVLKDVLSESLNKTNSVPSDKGGDNYFDIHIEVDELSSDYDVEQLTNKIKDEIKKDSMYRNVNTLNFLR